MKKLSQICQQYLDGEVSMGEFVDKLVVVFDDAPQSMLHLFATFIVGGEFDEEG